MLDLGWSEMAVIALVALLILGPKELPNALRTVALWVRKARKLAREFQSGVDELVREAELDEAKKTLQSASRTNLNRELEKTIDPTGEVSKAVKPDFDDKKPVAISKAENPPASDAPSSEAQPNKISPKPSPEPAEAPIEAPTSKSA
ncbi:Sec-independent protein translocase protein TatB [Rhodospirillaceae bacterium SYSU D60014]|uniref:Sec-independent protein translocase protein TatB n=1 Tax=Virgifigura deserti TaxID=2268457 RepID=UPI000E66B014